MTDDRETDGQLTENARTALTGSFCVERSLPAALDRVFGAYADTAVRRRWFRIHGNPADLRHELDFRPGGGEISRGSFAPSGVALNRLAAALGEERISDRVEGG